MNGEDYEVGVEDIFAHVKDIGSLAHFARCQAQEAEMRANYAMNLAERAVLEAEAVRLVAESLTRTARSVAKLSLEHINNVNSAEYRSFKRGDILSAVREYSQKKGSKSETDKFAQTNSHEHEQTKTSSKREVLSDNNVVGLHDVQLAECPSVTDCAISDENGNPGELNGAQSTDPFQAADMPHEQSDQLVCVENLHRQLSRNSGSHFTEIFPESDEPAPDIVKYFDSTEALPIVWEDSYQGQSIRRPIPWSDKKNIRKVQRKLKDLEDSEEQLGTVVENKTQTTTETDNQNQTIQLGQRR